MAQQRSAHRIIRTAVVASIIALALLTSAALLYGHAAREDFYFNDIKELVKQHAGYDLQKSGPIEFSLLPQPSLRANRLKIANPNLSGNARLAEMDQFSIALRWLPLLRLQLQADVEINSPDINLHIDDSGRESWMTEELLTVSGGLPFELGRIDTWGMAFLFKNHQKNEILGFDLEQFDLDFTAGRANARIESAGRIGRSRFFAVGDAAYEMINNQLNLNVDFGAGEAANIKVAAIQAPSVTQWIRQNAPFFPLRGSVEGVVAFENRTPTGSLEIDATLASLGDLDYLTDALAPLRQNLGPVKAKGQLLLTGGDVDIVALDARLEHEQAKFYVSGNVSNLLSAVEAELKVKGETDRLSVLAVADLTTSGPAAGIIKRLGPVDVSASVKAGNSDFIISDLDLGLAHNSFTARVSGDIHLLKEGIHMEIDHLSKAADSSDLFKLFGIDHPALADSGALEIAANISGRNGIYGLTGAVGELQDGNIKTTLDGEVSLADDALQFDLNSGVDIKDISRVAAMLPEELTPYLGGLTGTAAGRISGTLDDISVSELEVNLAREDRSLIVKGNVSRLPHNPEPHIDFHFATKSPVDLEQYFSKLKGQQLTGPLDLIGSVRAVNNEIHVDNLILQAEQTDVEGDVRIDLNTEPARVLAVFDSRRFLTTLVTRDLDQVEKAVQPDVADHQDQDVAEQEKVDAVTATDPGKAFKDIISGIEIETEWIKDLHIYASFSAEQAKLGDYDLADVLLTIDARDGVFTLAEFQVKIDGRPTTFRGLINTRVEPPWYRFSGEIRGDTLEALLALDDGIFVGGELNGNFKLQSQGNTVGEFVENLDGEALLEMGPLDIRSNALTVFSSDIIHAILSGVTTKQEGRSTSSYDCAVLGVNISNGIARARRAFTMQARDYNLAGTGELDLNTGYIDFAVRPRARRGLGFSISTLIGGFRIRGHMATPKFGLSGGSFMTAMITGYALAPTTAALATNPATATILATGFFARGLFDRLTSGNFTCESTLRRIERRGAGQPPRRNPHVPKWR